MDSTDYASELLDDLHALEELERAERHALAAAEAEAEGKELVPRPPGVTVSDVGRCRRQVSYRETGTEADADYVDDKLAAILGTAIHKVVAEARRRRHPSWLVEERVNVPGLPRQGVLDAYDDERRRVDDLKTKSGRAMERMLARGRAEDNDRDQANVYALAVEDELGLPVELVTITYLNREGVGDDDASERLWTDEWTYDRAEALDALAKLHAVQDGLDAGELLPRDGRNPDAWPCNRCPFRRRCWDLEKVPAGYTALSWQAAPEEVQAAARELVVVKARLAQLQEREDELRATVVGHGGETFEDAEGQVRRIAWTRGSPPGTGGRLDSKAARRDYARWGEDPPTLGTSPRLTTPVVK